MEPGPTRDLFTKEYAKAILDSQFVLCPAGWGPSTYRLFETMEMGRVPVILSDEWVPPPGPLWEQFSVRIPEHLISDLPSILSSFSESHEAMGQQARLAWEQWFAKPVCFHRLIELCVDIQHTPAHPLSALRVCGSLFRSPHRRLFFGSCWRSSITKIKSMTHLPL